MSNLNIVIKTLAPIKENIKECEKLRYDSVGKRVPEQYLLSSKCAERIYNAEILVFGLYLDNLLAACCYVCDSFETLFIDQLFVKKEFQETGLYLGRTLLEHILENREEVESYFHFHPEQSKLFFLDDKSKSLYEKLGYHVEVPKISLMAKNLTKKS